MHPKSLLDLVFDLYGNINIDQKKRIYYLFVLMIVSSLLEIISIGLVIPFLGIMSNPERMADYSFLINIPLYGFNEISGTLKITIIFIVATVISGLARYLILLYGTKISFSIGTEFDNKIYKRTIYQSYKTHISRNTAEVVSIITQKTATVIYALNSCLSLCSSITILIFILIGLLYVSPKATLISFLLVGIFYYCIILLVRRKISQNGRDIADSQSSVVRFIHEGFGGIREIIIDNAHEEYCNNYKLANHRLRAAQASSHLISGFPRFAMESGGMVIIALLAYGMSTGSGGLIEELPFLGALALSAQKILPLMQQAYASWSGISGSSSSIQDVLLLLNQEISNNEGPPRKFSFENKIELINVSYKHEDSSEYVLKNINLTIERGDRIGIIGESGSGKSTLLDLIMGLIEPTDGLILVDGKPVNINLKGWYNNIAHVPQLIYLLDSSIERNIIFGRSTSDFDFEKLRAICEKVQIIDFIDSLPNGFKTIIGERGSRLSGGQRQRIGIARALYKNAKLIVLDEATSALDVKTESELINQIYKLDRDITMIFVAHRLSTLEKCDFIIELDKGAVSMRGRLSAIISSCK